MVDSARSTARGEVEILVGIDGDDPELERYRDYSLPIRIFPAGTRVGIIWNFLANAARGDILAMANDDLVFVSEGWDLEALRIRDEAGDKRIMIWPDDGSDRTWERCAFPWVTREWYEAVGYFAPPHFEFLCNDTWITDISPRIVKAPTIKLDHRHFSFGKAEYDETYARNRRNGATKRDLDLYRKLADKRVEDRQKLA